MRWTGALGDAFLATALAVPRDAASKLRRSLMRYAAAADDTDDDDAGDDDDDDQV